MSELKISTAFLFAYRQSAGETPAIRRSNMHFKIAGVSPVFIQDRRRLACVHSGSQAKRLRSFSIFVKKNCPTCPSKIAKT
ncbi:MAG: hypothetical protein LBP59_14155 [Planctomycetaceae bacterium]|jgi:hypothetical protein|nr:hypothetical protein [Planctomycetaceae bacterium]